MTITGSSVNITVELATVVSLSEAIQSKKCSASMMAEEANSRHCLALSRNNSARYFQDERKHN